MTSFLFFAIVFTFINVHFQYSFRTFFIFKKGVEYLVDCLYTCEKGKKWFCSLVSNKCTFWALVCVHGTSLFQKRKANPVLHGYLWQDRWAHRCRTDSPCVRHTLSLQTHTDLQDTAALRWHTHSLSHRCSLRSHRDRHSGGGTEHTGPTNSGTRPVCTTRHSLQRHSTLTQERIQCEWWHNAAVQPDISNDSQTKMISFTFT